MHPAQASPSWEHGDNTLLWLPAVVAGVYNPSSPAHTPYKRIPQSFHSIKSLKMKILFSHKLMGIVVSSRQTSNNFWHSVTCLNAICVLISSLQRPWPLEEKGVRWFSPFPSPCLVPSSSGSSLISFSLPLLAPCPLLLLVSLYTVVLVCRRVSAEYCVQQTKAAWIVFVPFSVVWQQDIDGSAARRIGLLEHTYISVLVPGDSGVQCANPLSV